MISIRFLGLLCIIFLSNSCNFITPSSFWLEYKTNKIVSKYSDFGNGHLGIIDITWKIDQGKEIDDFLNFAKKNNWELMDSIKVNVDTMSFETRKTFGIERILYSETFKFETNLIYCFKTNMIFYDYCIYPKKTISENGFLAVSNDKKNIALYFKWGKTNLIDCGG